MRPIRIATLSLLAVAALALTACYSIRSQDVAQLDGIGDVQIQTTICQDQSAAISPSPNGCQVSNQPNSSSTPTNLLIAYRVADGTGAPDTLDAPNNGSPYTFTKDQSYSDSLNSVAAAAGEHWVGYKADQAGPSGTDLTVTGRFTLPKPAGGKPFQGPFKYRTVVGFQHLSSQTAPQDPVVCAGDPTQPSAPNSNGTTSVCIDSPDSSTWPGDDNLATRDLGITVGDPTSVQQGASGQVPFTAEFAGASDSSTFDLSLASDAPNGVTLTPSATTLQPASDSSTPISVKADVAPTVPTGTYNVTLTARNSAGQVRTGTAKLVVALGKPVNLALPFIGGTGVVGQTVSCSNGDWSSNPSRFAFQWTRNGTDIAGATSNSYKLTQDDGALLVACRVTASNAVADASATSGPIRAAQEGGADVNLNGRVKVTKNSNGTYTVDTGITVSCPPRLPKSCGGGNHVTANIATASAVKEVAHGGFAAKPGSKLKVVMRLSRSASKTLTKLGSLKLTAKVVTRNHLLQKVTSQKQFTVKRPR